MIKKLILTSIKIFVIFLLILFLLPFLISPVYDFPEPKKFEGKYWYNPYQNMDSLDWKKGNFQIQSLAWGGITDGSNNPTDSIISRYSKLGYDIIGISDYQKINKVLEGKEGYIPIYEHGFNFHKTHQVNIGVSKVFWLDFPFYQNKHHKQFIIDYLREHTDVLALAHPDFSLEGYTKNELKYLCNYDLIEALNHQRFSLAHWDAALSAGRPAFILADDDAHDLTNPFLYGVVSTYINSKTLKRESITNAMKSGNSYGFTPYTPDDETFEKKVIRSKNFPVLKSVIINKDTLTIKTGGNPISFQFIGQDGKQVYKTKIESDSATYILQDSDTYIRTEIDFGNGQKMYLNPIIRTNAEQPKMPIAKINTSKTLIVRLSSWIVLVALFYLIFAKRKNKINKK